MIFRLNTTARKVFAAAVFLAVICYGVSLYVAHEQKQISTDIRTLIGEQEATLTALVETIDKDGAATEVGAVVRDCAPVERERFDFLLSNLQTLRGAELQEVERLFAACGGFYAERKAMMVALLEREFEVYQSYIRLLATLDSKAEVVSYPIDVWQALIALENARSEHTTELVSIQGVIIEALITGEPVSGAVIASQLALAKETKDNLSLAGVQIDALRQQLSSL